LDVREGNAVGIKVTLGVAVGIAVRIAKGEGVDAGTRVLHIWPKVKPMSLEAENPRIRETLTAHTAAESYPIMYYKD
jgi:hypothetical protein